MNTISKIFLGGGVGVGGLKSTYFVPSEIIWKVKEMVKNAS